MGWYYIHNGKEVLEVQFKQFVLFRVLLLLIFILFFLKNEIIFERTLKSDQAFVVLELRSSSGWVTGVL